MLQIVKIKKIVEACLEYVQTDFESKTDEKDSFLYKVLGDALESVLAVNSRNACSKLSASLALKITM